MKSTIVSSLISALAAVFATNSPASQPETLVAANTAFGLDLLQQVAQAKPQANVFLSPFSVSSVLQMVANRAAGQTKVELQQALRTAALAPDTLNPSFRDLDAQFSARPDVILNLANGMWVQQGLELKPAFVADNQKFFQAELAPVDFSQPQAAAAINDWADRKTKGRIKDVVHFPFPDLTRLLLANAIYFKGTWVTPFHPNATRPRVFHLAGGPTKPTPMMWQDGKFSYLETADFQAVKLPYQGGLQMELYLPATGSNPRKLLAGLAARDWQRDVQAGFARRDGVVTLPKFKLQYEIVLNDALQALGMKSAFAGRADFSGIADAPLSISEVKQKSFVDVNEQGTEAAAVTTVTMLGHAMVMPPPDRFTMILDRPFFFTIADANTSSILFLGIVNDPPVGN